MATSGQVCNSIWHPRYGHLNLRYFPDWAKESLVDDPGTVYWISKKQHVVSLSCTKEEYRSSVKGECEEVWPRRVLANLQVDQNETVLLSCDNYVVFKLAKNLVFHEHTKHVGIHLSFYLTGCRKWNSWAEILPNLGLDWRHSHQVSWARWICKI